MPAACQRSIPLQNIFGKRVVVGLCDTASAEMPLAKLESGIAELAGHLAVRSAGSCCCLRSSTSERMGRRRDAVVRALEDGAVVVQGSWARATRPAASRGSWLFRPHQIAEELVFNSRGS